MNSLSFIDNKVKKGTNSSINTEEVSIHLSIDVRF